MALNAVELAIGDFRLQLLLATQRERVVFNGQIDLVLFISGSSAFSTNSCWSL